MDWNALVGGLIGAGIPAALVYLGLHRARQSADAEVFGPAVLLLDRLNPERVTINLNPDAIAEGAKWAELQRQLDVARERLLVVSAGHPRRHVRKLAQTGRGSGRQCLPCVKLGGAGHAAEPGQFRVDGSRPEHARRS